MLKHHYRLTIGKISSGDELGDEFVFSPGLVLYCHLHRHLKKGGHDDQTTINRPHDRGADRL